jgi:hypothetical protein
MANAEIEMRILDLSEVKRTLDILATQVREAKAREEAVFLAGFKRGAQWCDCEGYTPATARRAGRDAWRAHQQKEAGDAAG